MSKAPTFDDVFDVMSAASVGDLTARVNVHADAPLDDTTTTFALALNILLEDLAVSASRARAELTERERLALRVQALVDASQEFAASTGDIDQLLDIVARRLGELVGDMCAIRQLSADGEWLESGGAIYHKRPEMLEAARALSLSGRQRVGEGISGRVAASGKPFIAARVDTRAYVAMTEAKYTPFLEYHGVSSAITIPLVCRGRVVGIANLLRGSDSPPYDDNDLQSVQSVADHAALAIDNARSYAAERTARAAAEEATRAMREAQARFSRLSEVGIVGLLVVEMSTARIVEVNDALLAMIGYSREELVSDRFVWGELTPPEWRNVDVRAREQLAASGVAGLREKELIRKDGTRVPVILGSAMIEGTTRSITFLLDLTQRRTADEALRVSEARYRIMFDNSPLPKWVYDADTHRLLDVNAEAIRDYGFTREELLTMTIDDICLPEPTGAVHAAKDESTTLGISRLRTKAGPTILVELTTHTFDFAGRLTRIAIGRDVTERARLEEQLRQSQKMEAVGRLAGGVAHDFNNVLSVILSYSDMLLGDVRLDESTRAELAEIRKAGMRAAELTRQLLMFSRKQVLAPKVVDLNDTLETMDTMLQRILGADIDLVALPARSLGQVRVDPSSMEQVIMNLVVNARDALPTGGKLTLETDNVILDDDYARTHLGAASGPHVMLAVSDNGVGMDAATLSRIFEPFFTTKEAGKGTGLGLATVYGIVQQSGGSVWAYSELGVGTTFKIYLPCVDAAVLNDAALVPSAPERGSETILLVEDDDQVRAVAHRTLVKSGYLVMEARNASDALSQSERYEGAIHLLLSDVVMPQMSGPELAKRLSRTRPDMKVLCMSGYTDDSIVRHGVLEAEIAFLQKPITPPTLTAKVREVLGRSSA